jgi:hypothetical protein
MEKIFLVLSILLLASSCNQFAQMNSGSEFAPMPKPNVTVPGEMTEIFIQGKQARALDILWIIDNSGSMSNDQTRLAENFNLFIQDFVSNQNDFQMAITTTDTSSAAKRGLMVLDSDVKLNSLEATRDSNLFIEDFKTLIKVGTSGSGRERGLEAMKGFLERYGNTFLRSDAFFAVVIVSDEKDQSSESVSHYVDFAKSYKSNAGLVRINAIVNFSQRERYEEAVTATSGSIADITKNFSSTLKDLGTSLFNLTNSFPLSEWPKPETMTVYVNGQPQTDFAWDATTNSVHFTNGAPAEGSEIKLVYKMDK